MNSSTASGMRVRRLSWRRMQSNSSCTWLRPILPATSFNKALSSKSRVEYPSFTRAGSMRLTWVPRWGKISISQSLCSVVMASCTGVRLIWSSFASSISLSGSPGFKRNVMIFMRSTRQAYSRLLSLGYGWGISRSIANPPYLAWMPYCLFTNISVKNLTCNPFGKTLCKTAKYRGKIW